MKVELELEKKRRVPKMFFDGRKEFIRHRAENSSHGYQTTSGQQFFITLKVLKVLFV